MTEPVQGGGLAGAVTRKVGPLALWQWVGLVGGGGYIVYKMRKGSSSTTGTANPGQGTQFNSSTQTTSTNPQTGVSTTDTYSAQGNGYLPGQLTYQAGPMPTSTGDVYVNYPSTNNTTPTPPPANPNAYEYGQAEINYMMQNIGKYNITQAAIDKVQKAYQQVLQNQGQAIANNTHYHLNTNGTVTPIMPTLDATGNPVPPAQYAGGAPAW